MHPFLYDLGRRNRGQSAVKEWPVCITSYTRISAKSQVAVPINENTTFALVICIYYVITVMGIVYYSRV